MSNLQNLTVAQLREVVAIKEQIETLQSQLDSLISGGPVTDGRKKRHMSPAARAAIAAAQRARWAKVKKGKGKGAAAAASGKPKRKVSAAARAKLAAIAKARWAKVKASGKSKL
jgi:hypothetical protein